MLVRTNHACVQAARGPRAERFAGPGVVLAIFVCARVAGVFAIEKIISPDAAAVHTAGYPVSRLQPGQPPR